jgi:gallate decarboxylase subunit C
MTHKDIYDLRSALEFLNSNGIDIEIDNTSRSIEYDIASDFARRGSGRPSKNKMISNPVIYADAEGYGIPVLMGLLNSRKVCASLLGLTEETAGIGLAPHLNDETYKPVHTDRPDCQQNIVNKNIDIAKLLPILKFTRLDAGKFINLGLLYAEDPETGESDVTIHRMCVQGPDTLTVYLIKGRHIEQFYRKAKRMNKPLPVTIHIGVDPAIYIAAVFSYPACPLGFNELNVAGAIRRRGVAVADASSVKSKCIAHAEIVVEGEILPDQMPENQADPEGNSLPEFLGYIGRSQSSLPIVKIKAITYRNNPIYQTIVGPGGELSNLCGLPTEASIYRNISDAITGNIVNCYCSPAGGGKLLAFLQFVKKGPLDDAIVRQSGLAAFSAFHELKNVFLLDDDVDIFDHEDVMWALSTRFQGNHSIMSIENLNGHPLDPSQNPLFSRGISEIGTTNKTVFDCTIPFKLRENFTRVAYE